MIKKYKILSNTRGACSALAILLLIGGAHTAHATILYSQETYDTNTPALVTGNDYVQPLGNGLSGTIRSIKFKTYGDNSGASGQWNIRIGHCTNGNNMGSPACTGTWSGVEAQATTTAVLSSNGSGYTIIGGDLNTSITLNPSYYYFIWVSTFLPSGEHLTGTSATLGAGNTYTYGYTYSTSPVNTFWYEMNDQTENTSYQTNITTTTPYNTQTVASSTTFTIGSTGYITTNDFISNQTYLKIKLQRNTDYINQTAYNAYWAVGSPQCIGILGIFNLFCFNSPQEAEGGTYLSSSGSYSWSTTTPITADGRYTMTQELHTAAYSLFGLSFGDKTLYATTTTFTVNTLTSADQLIDSVASSTLAIQSNISNKCNIISFDLLSCISGLFIPTAQDFKPTLDNLKTNVLTVAPWGYVTRFMSIVAGTATSTLPSLIIDFSHAPPAEAALASGASLNLTPWDKLMGPGSIFSQATSTYDGKSFRDIVEPGWNMFIGVLFGIIIITEIIGIGNNFELRKDIRERI